ncbi:MAG: hypothetical protein HUJ54_14115, partial [Erysipelotrichaceae bacterium]|nr:hypothetical protein [Erysipelotrichaceae bacterium]
GENMGGFDVTKMLQITDAAGEQVEASVLMEGLSTLKSAELEDGTVIDLENFDPKTMANVDLSKIKSVTDQDGNTLDLSEYTISFGMSGAGRMENGQQNMQMQGGFGGQMPNGGMQTPPDFQQQNQNAAADSQNSANTGGSFSQMQPPGQNDASGSQMTPPDQSDGSMAQMTPPDMQNSSADSQNGQTENSQTASPNKQTPPDQNQQKTSSKSSQAVKTASTSTLWILTGVSGIVLAAGLILALVKKQRV